MQLRVIAHHYQPRTEGVLKVWLLERGNSLQLRISTSIPRLLEPGCFEGTFSNDDIFSEAVILSSIILQDTGVENMFRYVSPINPAIYPQLSLVLLAIGVFFMAWFFVYPFNNINNIMGLVQAHRYSS